jgi:tetratricopeptide (TPR) repeat protein
VKLNAEVDTVTAARYRVRSYPTVLVLRPDGIELDRVVGYYRAPEFMGQVDDYLAGRNTLGSMAAAESTQGSDPAFLAKLADRFFEHGLYEDAKTRYVRLVAVDPANKSGLVDDALMSLARMSRKDKDYAAARRYAQRVLDRYPDSDAIKSAFLEVGINWKRSGHLEKARKVFLDYAGKFPGDEDAPWAREQADTLAVKLGHTIAIPRPGNLY